MVLAGRGVGGEAEVEQLLFVGGLRGLRHGAGGGGAHRGVELRARLQVRGRELVMVLVEVRQGRILVVVGMVGVLGVRRGEEVVRGGRVVGGGEGATSGGCGGMVHLLLHGGSLLDVVGELRGRHPETKHEIKQGLQTSST